jgi:hypothetical protein
MDIASGLAATGNAITLLKAIKDADSAIDAATLKSKLAEVMNELADAKISQIELIEKIRGLEEENARLLKSGEEIGNLIEKDGYLYRPSGNDVLGWPACPTCITKEKFVSLLVQNGDVTDAKCPRCLTEFSPVTSYVSPGYTRREQHLDERRRKNKAANEALSRLNRTTGYY